eukprot:scaffold16255_cov48-Prasinocladus_malaysianus.AAC.1
MAIETLSRARLATIRIRGLCSCVFLLAILQSSALPSRVAAQLPQQKDRGVSYSSGFKKRSRYDITKLFVLVMTAAGHGGAIPVS